MAFKNKRQLEQYLGITRPTLNKHMKKLGITSTKDFTYDEVKLLTDALTDVMKCKEVESLKPIKAPAHIISRPDDEYIVFPGSDQSPQIMELEKLYNKYKLEAIQFDDELKQFMAEIGTYIYVANNGIQMEHKAFIARLKLEDKMVNIIKAYKALTNETDVKTKPKNAIEETMGRTR